MTDPRRLLLPFAALAAATAIAAMDQTSASLFSGASSQRPFSGDAFDDHATDALVRALSTSEDAAGGETSDGFQEMGRASWYGQWHHGRTTASGERFDMNRLTAAHRTLPLGTQVRVTNLGNGRSVAVTIHDRGPYIGTRVIDLSHEAARELNMEREGLASVLIEEVRPAEAQRSASDATE